jgi:NADPH-dependent 2,4-dienoyl-CoA reductase/sulfur reductase-like enzyme
VLCDATGASSLPDVVAVGDVARMPNAWLGKAAGTVRTEHWTHAVEQSSHAARRLLEGPSFAEPFSNVPYFWSDQHGVKIQFAGAASPLDQIEVVDGSLEARRFVALYGREGRVMGTLAIGRPALLVRYRKQMSEGLGFEQAVQAAQSP